MARVLPRWPQHQQRLGLLVDSGPCLGSASTHKKAYQEGQAGRETSTISTALGDPEAPGDPGSFWGSLKMTPACTQLCEELRPRGRAPPQLQAPKNLATQTPRPKILKLSRPGQMPGQTAVWPKSPVPLSVCRKLGEPNVT